jgi:hypothetical protein
MQAADLFADEIANARRLGVVFTLLGLRPGAYQGGGQQAGPRYG